MNRQRTSSAQSFGFPLAVLAMLLLASGCEDENPVGPGDVGTPDEETEYIATLEPLNGSGVSGTAVFRIDTDDNSFEVEVDAFGPAEVEHPQHIHLASACPTAAADANGDGFVDVLEGLPAYGRILISLDDDLEENRFGEGDFPDDETIDYEESAELDDLIANLRRSDEDPNDAVATLGAGEGLNLETRTVVLHGVSPEITPLPISVKSLGGLDRHTTLPIACGRIVRR